MEYFGLLLAIAAAIALIVLSLKIAAPKGPYLEPGEDPPTRFIPTHVCSNCRTPIRPIERAEGSGVVELLLWLFFLVPGIIYSIWRASTRKPRCPICAAPHPIPIGTPAAETLTTPR